MDGGRLPVQVAHGAIEAQALAASQLVEKDVPAAPTAPRALEPRQRLVRPHHQHAVPVDPKIGAVSGELVSPVTPSQLSHCPIDKPADAVEHRRVEACAALDQAIERDAGVAMIVAQTKTANHGCENIKRACCRSSGFLSKLSDQPDAS